MGIHYDYKSTKSAKLMEKQAKREKKLAEKKAKRLAKEGQKNEEPKDKVIDQNSEIPRITEIISSPDIYIPIFAFICLVITTVFLRKLFYKN